MSRVDFTKYKNYFSPENRKELYLRYFWWRRVTDDLDHKHLCVAASKNMSDDEKISFAFYFGMTYRVAQAYTDSVNFPRIELSEDKELTDWNNANYSRYSVGTDLRYNKGHFDKQVISIKKWIGDLTLLEKVKSIITSEDSHTNFLKLTEEIDRNCYKFGRMSCWIALQAIHDVLGFNIEPNNILFRSPNSDSSMASVWNGLCMLRGDYDRVVLKDSSAQITADEIDLAKIDYVDLKNEAKNLFGFDTDMFMFESIHCQFKRLLIHPNNSKEWPGHCLTGDTKISLLNGTEVPIKDLVGVPEFWVYSCLPNGEIVPGRGHSARITKYIDEIYEITLDNGEVVKCTDNHPFMMRDGTYKRADELTVEDSLMPLYREIEEIEEIKSIKMVKLDKKIPVYDITVDDHHNFALSSGIFVHNSTSDATSRYIQYRNAWPEIDFKWFREALRAQRGLIKGLDCHNSLNHVFGETGGLLNMHEAFDDMPNIWKLINKDPNDFLIKEIWTDDGLPVPYIDSDKSTFKFEIDRDGISNPFI